VVSVIRQNADDSGCHDQVLLSQCSCDIEKSSRFNATFQFQVTYTLSVSDSCPNGSVLPTLYIGKLAKVRLLGLQHLVYTATLAYALTTLFHFIFIY